MVSTPFYNNTSAVVNSGGTDAPASGTVEDNWEIISSSGFPTSLTSGIGSFHIADIVAPSEKILVTAISSGTWTVTRGVEGTTPVTHTTGFTIQQIVTAGDFSAFRQTIIPSGDETGVADAASFNNAVESLPSTGGTIEMFPGNWYLKPGGVVIALGESQPVQINGNGSFINTVNGSSGDLIRFYGTASSSAAFRSAITNLTIDGSNASTAVTGLHTGDLTMLKLDVVIQNFTAATCVGLNIDNSISWTEECDLRALVSNCTNNVIIQATTGYGSFEYNNFDFTVFAGPTANGVQILNGASVVHSSMRIRGNFETSTTAITAAVFSMSGINTDPGPSSGLTTIMTGNRLEIQVECNGAGTYRPQTIYMDPVNYAYAAGNYGILNFLVNPGGVTFATSNFVEGQFSGQFIVNGDPVLGVNDGYGAWQRVGSPVLYSYAVTPSAGQVPTAIGDFTQFTLTTNTTVTLSPADFAGITIGQPQRVTIVAQQAASGGPFTLTWPHTASSSVTHTTVLWAGGTVPAMSTAASAVDVYKLETINGAIWYGQAIQHVS